MASTRRSFSSFVYPINWRRFPRDFAIIQIGFALFGLSIAILIQANLGTSPWVMLSVALADILSLTPGNLTIIIGMAVLVAAILMGERVGWGTIGNILFIGLWVDLFLWLLPSVTGNWLLQFGMVIVALLMMGLATGIYIGVNAGAGPRDSLMLAIQRKTGLQLRWARSSIELFVFVTAWLLGGPFGLGTVIFALFLGMTIQWGFKIFGVDKGK